MDHIAEMKKHLRWDHPMSPLEFIGAARSEKTENKTKRNTMPSENSIVGTATIVDLGYAVINETNGRLEHLQGPSIIPGLTSGNVRDMQTERKNLELKFAQASELTTDASSPDDAQRSQCEQRSR